MAPSNKAQSATLLFVHVPKTAGTTLRVVIEQQYLGQGLLVIQHDIPGERARFAAMGEQEKRALRAVFGHMCWGWHEHLATGQPYAYATMLRDPVERVLSLWAHAQLIEHYLGAAVRGMDLVKFLTSGVTQTADNATVRQLCGRDRFQRKPGADMLLPLGSITRADLDAAKAHLDECAVVGVAEQFPRFIGEMNRRYAWRVTSWRNQNVTRWPRLKKSELDKRTLAALEDSTALDRELYQHAIRRMEGQK
jgi:hypothetical protein